MDELDEQDELVRLRSRCGCDDSIYDDADDGDGEVNGVLLNKALCRLSDGTVVWRVLSCSSSMPDNLAFVDI